MDQHARILDQLVFRLRSEGYSRTTEKAFHFWVKDFLEFHPKLDPASIDSDHVESFLNHLITDRYAPTAIQNQALHALRFCVEKVGERDAKWLIEMIKPLSENGHRSVLSPSDCQHLLAELKGENWLAAALIYGAGLRLSEVIRLRICDLDQELGQIRVRPVNGGNTRITMLPNSVIPTLQSHLQNRHVMHLRTIAEQRANSSGNQPAHVAVAGSSRRWIDQPLFIGHGLNEKVDPAELAASINGALAHAAIEAEIYQLVSADTLRTSFAVELVHAGADRHVVTELLGLASHAATDGDELPHQKVVSPLDSVLNQNHWNQRMANANRVNALGAVS